MTDETAASNPTDTSPTPQSDDVPRPAADSVVATTPREAPTTSPRPPDRAQQILTVAVLFLIAVSVVLAVISAVWQ